MREKLKGPELKKLPVSMVYILFPWLISSYKYNVTEHRVEKKCQNLLWDGYSIPLNIKLEMDAVWKFERANS